MEASEMPVMPEGEQPKKKTKVWLIVLIVAIVLCCCCGAVVALGFNFGDQIISTLGLENMFY